MIEKFEEKINDIKRRINKKAMGVIIFMIFGAVSVFAMDVTNNFKRQKQQVEDTYNQSMYETVGYINNIKVELEKVQVSNTRRLTSTTFASIWRQSNMAKENIEKLPVNQNSLSKASKYLSQLSDFSYSLMKQTISDVKITDEEYTQIAYIYEDCSKLSDVMQIIYDDLNNGRINWDKLKKSGENTLPEADIAESISSVEEIGKSFQEYEGLIYDGAFSDHLLHAEPKSLDGKEASLEDAKNYLNTIFGSDNIESVTDLGESQGTIDLYNFEVKLINSDAVRNISITKKGCKIYLMISDRRVEKENLDIQEAKQKGIEFLKSLGIDDVKDTYYLKTENMAIINYAGVQDKVTLYPDLIKVKVALDTGEICSFESEGYIFNHIKRTNLIPTKTAEEARAVINKNIVISKESLAVIPTDSKSEILTYEFMGKIGEREFLIYVNANTLVEEKVLLITDTPGGVLTM
jgi:germination protein YpeB